MATIKYTWFASNGEHLAPGFVKHLLPHLDSAAKVIHFVASTATYHSFAVVMAAHSAHMRALAKASSNPFRHALVWHTRQLEDILRWGWERLASLATPAQSKPLLFRARLTLALRCHNNYLKLMKLGLCIPANPGMPIL